MKEIILITILFLLCNIFVFSQCENKDSLDKQNCENEQSLKSIKEIQKEQIIPINYISEYLPKNENSWVLALIENGGWAGGSRINSLVNSSGKFICRKDNNLLSQNLSLIKFENLSNLVNKTAFNFFPTTFNQEDSQNDVKFGQLSISHTNLIVVQNAILVSKKGKKREANLIYEYSLRNFPNENSPINKIATFMLESASCLNES